MKLENKISKTSFFINNRILCEFRHFIKISFFIYIFLERINQKQTNKNKQKNEQAFFSFDDFGSICTNHFCGRENEWR